MIKKLAHYLIRPQRAAYQEKDLGDREFTIGDHEFIRTDFNLKNPRGYTIKCSVFEPIPRQEGKVYDCIVFCHGNSGNRCSIFECLDNILECGFIAVSFDFSGCGNSEGKYISLGHYEKYDIQVVVNFLRTFNYIGQQVSLLLFYEILRGFQTPSGFNYSWLWGRSMGAASVLLYTELDQDISALCLDSPFRSLKSLIQDFMDKFKIITNLFGDILYEKVSKYVQEEVNLEIESIQPISSASKSRISAIFVHAVSDKIIDKNHTDDIVKVYKGRKKYYNVSGDHNDMRNQKLYEEILQFFKESFMKNQSKINNSMDQLSNKPSLQYLDNEEDIDSQFRNYANRKSKRSSLFFKQGSSNSIGEEDNNDGFQHREFQIRKGKIKQRRETIILKNFVEISSNEDLDSNIESQGKVKTEEEKEDTFDKLSEESQSPELQEINHRKKQQRKNMTRSEKIIIIQGDVSQSEDGMTSRDSSPLPEDIGLIKFQSSKEIKFSQIHDIIEKTPTSLTPNRTSFSQFSQFSQSQRQTRQNEEELIPDEDGKNVPVTQDLCKFMYSKTTV